MDQFGLVAHFHNRRGDFVTPSLMYSINELYPNVQFLLNMSNCHLNIRRIQFLQESIQTKPFLLFIKNNILEVDVRIQAHTHGKYYMACQVSLVSLVSPYLGELFSMFQLGVLQYSTFDFGCIIQLVCFNFVGWQAILQYF